MSKKVLLLTFEMPPYITGGIGSVAYDTTKEFLELGYEVTVIGPKDSRDFDLKSKYRSISSKSNIVKFTQMLLKGLFEIYSTKYDYVYCLSGTYSGMVAYILNKVSGIPYFIVAHGNEFIRFKNSKFFFTLIKRVYNNCLKVFAVSEFTKKKLIDFGLQANHVYTCYNGVDLNRYYSLPESERKEKRTTIGITNTDLFIILTVSRLDKRKGHINAIKAISEIENENILYLIAGTGQYTEAIQRTIDSYNLASKVKMLGYISDKELNSFYNIADLFIMPNIYIEEEGNVEGFGLVFLEAGATKLPSIGGNIGGSAEAIVDNTTGFIVDGQNISAIKEKLQYCLNNRQELTKMGFNAYQRAQEFAWPNIINKIVKVINVCLK